MTTSEQDLQNIVSHCEKALYTLYNDTNPASRDNAHKWLLSIQKSLDAWQLCWRLLHKDKPQEVQFFGASVLYFKISKNWQELSSDHYEALRTELLNHVLAYAKGPRIVSTRLCVALGAFAIQMMPQHWDNSVSEIISTFQSAAATQDSNLYTVLLEVLTVLPEEFASTSLIATRKMEVRGELQSAINQVLQIAQQGLATQSSASNKLQTLRCLNSWVQFGCSISDLDAHLPHVFQALADPELFDSAVDLLVDVVTHPSTDRLPNCLWKFLSSFTNFHSTLRQSLESGDMDTASGLCRIISSFAETHTTLLLTPETSERNQLTMQAIQALLECTNAPGWYPVDEQCSEITFNFWYMLQEAICNMEPALMMQLCTVYVPVFLSLTQIFLRKIQYPSDTEWSQYSTDEKEQFRYYRQDVADTMMYIYCVMRSHLLHQLYSTLHALLSSDPPSTWQSVEATLYLVQSVSENVEPEEESIMPAIFSLLSQLPPHAIVSQTALLMVGSYSEWLKCHPEQLRTVLPVLLSGLCQENLASASTQALRGICEECVQDLESDVQQTILTHCQAALAGKVIKERERIRCMECVGYTLSVNPPATMMEKLQTSVGPYVHFLADLASQRPTQETKPKMQFYLKMFAVLFKCLDPEGIQPGHAHPAAVVLKEVLPSLKALQPWVMDNDVMQDFCLCIERAVDTIRDHMGGLVAELAHTIVAFYTATSSGPLLDSSAMFVGMYGCEEPHYATVAAAFQKIATYSLQLLQTNLREHEDILQYLMQLVVRALKANARMVFDCEGLIAHIVHCGLMAIELPEAYAVKAASHFFVTFINTYETMEVTRQTLEVCGQHLVDQVIKGVGGAVPRHCVEILADILVALNKNCKTLLTKCMQPFIRMEGIPSPLVNAQQKQHFTTTVLRAHANKKRVKDAAKEFSLLCRGLYGTPYAAWS